MLKILDNKRKISTFAECKSVLCRVFQWNYVGGYFGGLKRQRKIKALKYKRLEGEVQVPLYQVSIDKKSLEE